MKTIIIALLIVTFSFALHAKECDTIKPDYRFMRLGLGFVKTSMHDQINTCLPYSGAGLGVDVSYESLKKKHYLSFGNLFSVGMLMPYKLPEYSNMVNYYSNFFDGKILWQVYNLPQQSLRIFTGPQLRGMLGIRINYTDVANSALSYEIAGSVMIAARAEKKFSLQPIFKKANPDENFCATLSFAYPILATALTPPYIGMPEDLLQEQSSIIDLKSNYNSIVTKFVNPEINASLRYTAKNGNALSFNYIFNYVSTKPEFNKSKSTYQYFGFCLLVNLK